MSPLFSQRHCKLHALCHKWWYIFVTPKLNYRRQWRNSPWCYQPCECALRALHIKFYFESTTGVFILKPSCSLPLHGFKIELLREAFVAVRRDGCEKQTWWRWYKHFDWSMDVLFLVSMQHIGDTPQIDNCKSALGIRILDNQSVVQCGHHYLQYHMYSIVYIVYSIYLTMESVYVP